MQTLSELCVHCEDAWSPPSPACISGGADWPQIFQWEWVHLPVVQPLSSDATQLIGEAKNSLEYAVLLTPFWIWRTLNEVCSSFTLESKHLIRYAYDNEGSRRNRVNVMEWKRKKEKLKKASFPFPGDTHAGSRTVNDCRETTAWDSAPLYLNLFLGHRGRLREAHTLDLWASFCHKIKIKSHRRNAWKLYQSLSAYRRQINK